MPTTLPPWPVHQQRLVRRLQRWASASLLATACTHAAAASADWPTRALQAVNQVRQQQGLPVLQAAIELQAIAQAHSDDMAARGRLSHDGFQARLDRADRTLCVENLAGGTHRPETLVAAWSRAPAHRRNLFEPRLRHAGVAAAQGYVTFFACE